MSKERRNFRFSSTKCREKYTTGSNGEKPSA